MIQYLDLNLLEGPHLAASLHAGGHPGEGEGAEVIASCFNTNIEDWIMNKTELTLTLPAFVQSLAQQVCLFCLGEGYLKKRTESVTSIYRMSLFSSHLHLRQRAALQLAAGSTPALGGFLDREIAILNWNTTDSNSSLAWSIGSCSYLGQKMML